MKSDRPWPLLAVASAALLIGAGTVWIKDRNEPLSFALAAAGMIVLGAWLTLEIQSYFFHRRGDHEGRGRVQSHVEGRLQQDGTVPPEDG